MKKEQVVAVLGGDMRQLYAAERLAEMAYPVYALGFRPDLPFRQVKLTDEPELLQKADMALFPLGVSKEGKLHTPLYDGVYLLRELLALLPKDCRIFGGNVTEAEQALAGEYGLHFEDYFKREELTVANALLTAEGAIRTAMEQMDRALWRSKCLICGYGRIGKLLHSRLQAFGMDVSVLARSPQQRVWAESAGAKAYDFSVANTILPHQQVIFNTVPAQWLREELALVAEDCPIIELASKPYGIDFALAEQLGKKAVLAAALPGKYAPRSAGEWIADTILNMR